MLKKRLVSVLLAMAMVLGLGAPAFAVEPAHAQVYQTSFAEGSVRAETISDTIRHTSQGRSGRYTTGSALVVYNSDTDVVFYMIPIFEGNTCISMIHMSQDLTVGVTRTINTVPYEAAMTLPEGDYILYITGGVLYAESADGAVELQDHGQSIPANEQYLALSYQEKVADFLPKAGNSCILSNVEDLHEDVFEVTVGTVSADGIMPYTEVPEREALTCNITNFVPQMGNAFCGAACVATIVNFKKGYNLSVLDVCTQTGLGPSAGEGDIASALSYYGLNYSVSYSKPSWSIVKKSIKDQYPFIVGLVQVGTMGGHVITAYGYECAYGDRVEDAGSRYVFAWDSEKEDCFSFLYSSTQYLFDGVTYEWKVSIKK